MSDRSGYALLKGRGFNSRPVQVRTLGKLFTHMCLCHQAVYFGTGQGSQYSITERRVPVLGSQPAGDVSHKPGSRLPLLYARPAVSPATLKRTATNFAA